MRAKVSLILAVVGLLLLYTGIQAEAPQVEPEAQVVVDVEQTSKACHNPQTEMVWFYKPPRNTSMSSVIANYDLYILTKGDERYRNQIHNAGERPVLQYLKFDALSDQCFQAKKAKGTRCSCSMDPRDNQVGWYDNDICWIRDNHPDWFLRDGNGNLLYWNSFVMMDPGNAGYRQWWLARAKGSMQQGWDGVFIDNMATKFGVHGTNFVKLRKYSTYKAYQDAVVGFLSYARNNYFRSANKKLYANISVRSGDNPVYLRYMDQMDGSMDEFWAYSRGGWYSTNEWMFHLDRAAAAVKKGKNVILVAQGARTDMNRQLFGYASYLLVASPTTFFRYTSDSGGYSEMWTYNNYQVKLGIPKGSYTRSGNTWTRNFANGKVTVNPETRKASIVIYNASGC